jgi:hypothetical protein
VKTQYLLLIYQYLWVEMTIKTYLANYGKKSIINIEDLGLSAPSRHSISRQSILRVIYRKLSIFSKFVYFRKAIFYF